MCYVFTLLLQNVGENENQHAHKSRRRGGQKPLAEQNTRTITKS